MLQHNKAVNMIMMLSLLLLDPSDLSFLSQSNHVGAAASAISTTHNTLKCSCSNGRLRAMSLANSSATFLAGGSVVDERGQHYKGLHSVGRGGFLQSSNSELKFRRRRSSHTMCMSDMSEKNSISNGQNTQPTTLYATIQSEATAETFMSKFRKIRNSFSMTSILSPTLSAGTTRSLYHALF